MRKRIISAALATAGMAGAVATVGVLAPAPAQAATGHWITNNCYPGTFHAILVNGPNYAGWDFVPCGQTRTGVTAIESPYDRIALCTPQFTNCVVYPKDYVMTVNYDHQAYTVR